MLISLEMLLYFFMMPHMISPAGSTDSDEPQLLDRPSSSDEELAHVTAPEMSPDQEAKETEIAGGDVRPS